MFFGATPFGVYCGVINLLSLLVGMAAPGSSGSNHGMSTHPVVEHLQALLVDQLIEDANSWALHRAAIRLRLDAERLADAGLSDDDDAVVAGWLAAMLRRLGE